MKNKILIAFVLLIITGMIFGCARFPSGGGGTSPRQITLSFTVRGTIDPSKHYFMVLYVTDTNEDVGPIPIVAQPWGTNGFVQGAATHYIRFDNSFPNYALFKFTSPDLSNAVQIPGIIAAQPPFGGNTLQVTLDIDQLGTTIGTRPIPAQNIQFININFITTDVVPTDPNFPGPRLFDGLGPLGNNFIQIPVVQSRTFINGYFVPTEEPGDVHDNNLQIKDDPTLDIVNWQANVLIR